MKTITYTTLRRGLKGHLDNVAANTEPLLVKRRGGEWVVLMSQTAYARKRSAAVYITEAVPGAVSDISLEKK